jgi:hypothetical protein
MRGRIAAAMVASLFVLSGPAAQAAAPVAGYRADDFGGGGFHDILPPGTNGLANGVQLAAFLATGQRPPHNDDQLGMYSGLVRATPGLTADDLGKYYKDASFGVQPDDVASTLSPRDDVTIVRDKGFGVPHISATTRGGAMFGEGYAAATDRLFFIDVLRHLGRAQLSSFAGGAPGNRAMDAEQWAAAPYTEDDLQRQIDAFDDLYGDEGRQLQADLAEYVAGVNQYISEAKLDPTRIPGEYATLGRPLGPDPWKGTDVIAIASLVGAIFGKGGGRELEMAQFLQHLQDRFGAKLGRRLWHQLAAFDDPDAPTTVKHQAFPYQRPPRTPAAGGEVLPDAGSLKAEPVAVAGAGTTDLRGEQVLPWALKIVGNPSDPGLKAAVATLKAWVASGAHRRDKDGDGHYDDAEAVRIMDAWWPRWLKAQFEPVLGRTVFETLPHQQDNAPNNEGQHLGSTYQEGWYGYAAKDLRTIAGDQVAQPYARRFCGGGTRSKCRIALRKSLKAALAVPASELYGGDDTCKNANRDGDQTCFDAISLRALGGVTQPLIPWVNRPTYQQAVEIPGHRPR